MLAPQLDVFPSAGHTRPSVSVGTSMRASVSHAAPVHAASHAQVDVFVRQSPFKLQSSSVRQVARITASAAVSAEIICVLMLLFSESTTGRRVGPYPDRCYSTPRRHQRKKVSKQFTSYRVACKLTRIACFIETTSSYHNLLLRRMPSVFVISNVPKKSSSCSTLSPSDNFLRTMGCGA